MCGIVGFTGTQNAAPVLLDGLSKLEYRGYDSAGIAVVQGNRIAISKVTGRIQNLREKTEDGRLVPGTTGIGHTRWATHGAPNDINAHPHASNDGKFAVVHNGIIENYMELREELLRKGYRFESETDTEVIVHLIEMYYAGDFRKAVMKASSRLVGSYALGIVCTDALDTVLAVREASPLILGVGIGENFFASDVTALVAHTRNVIYLEDGELAELTPDSIQVYDCSGHPITKKASRITWDIQAAEKGGYDHFMLKEIMEQPRAVEATITPRIRNGEIVLDDLNIDLSQIHKIVITACGSAYYAGCAGKYTIEKLCRIPVTTELASELRYADPLIDGHTLLIVLSQSGETADTIAAMKECQRRGAKALAIVNVVGSTIAKIADYTLYTWAGPEIAVATTKGYTTQLTVLYLFALYAAKSLGTVEGKEYKRLAHGAALPAQADADGAGHEPCHSCSGKEIPRQPLHVLHRKKHRLRRRSGRGVEDEGDLLHPRGILRGGRVETRHHRPDLRGAAGDCPVLQRRGHGEDHEQHRGGQGAGRGGARGGLQGEREDRFSG